MILLEKRKVLIKLVNYYEVVMEMPNRFYSIERPKKAEKLHEVLSKEEIKRMIRMTNNIKHRCIISLLYSCGTKAIRIVKRRKGQEGPGYPIGTNSVG